MATRTITGTIYDGQGNPVSGARASFTMDRGTYLLDPDLTYVASSATAVSDADGEFSVTLEAGLPVLWNVTLPSQTFVISIPTGDPTTLEALRAEYSGGPPAINNGNVPYMSVFNVTSPLYGAEGDGTTDDTTAIQAAMTAAALVNGTVFFPRGTYKTTAALTMASTVTLLGEGRGSIIAPSGTGFNTFALTGTLGSSASLASNATEGSDEITLTAGSVASLGLAVGDVIWINDTVPAPAIDDATGHDQITIIAAIVGEVITTADALYEPFLTANSAIVRKMTPKTGTGLRNLTLDGTNLTGAARGFLWTNVKDCFIEGCEFRNFLSAGAYFERGYGNAARDCHFLQCGSASESDLSWSRQTSGAISNILSERASGFGPQLLFSNNNDVSNVRSVGSLGRGMKLHTASYNRLTNISCVRAAHTGFGITLESDHNLITNLTTINNGQVTTGEGIWFHTNGNNDFNIILGAVSRGNSSYELAFNTGCDNNYVTGWFDTAGFGVRQNGTDNVYVNLLTSSGFDVHGAGKFSGDVTVPDEVYGSGWNGSLEVPTKNAVYDKIETLPSSSHTHDADYVNVTGDTMTGGLVVRPPSANPMVVDAAAGFSTFFRRFSSDAVGGQFLIQKSRHATFGSHAVLNSGDDIAAWIFYGSDGTAFREAAKMVIAVDGTPGASDMPGRIIFSVTPDGSATAAEALRISNDKTISASGNVTGTGSIKSTGTAGVGYGTGAGGTVTQATDKSTGVTLNKTCGQITLNNASLAAGTIVSFTLTNSTIAAGDVVVLNHLAGGTIGAYTLNAQSAAGSATINVRNTTAGALGEAVVIAFAVVKAVTS